MKRPPAHDIKDPRASSILRRPLGDPFGAFLARPANGPRRPPGGYFGAFPLNGPCKPPGGPFGVFLAPGRQMVPGGHQEIILENFWPQPGKWPLEAFRKPFWSISGPSPANGPRRPPGGHFGARVDVITSSLGGTFGLWVGLFNGPPKIATQRSPIISVTADAAAPDEVSLPNFMSMVRPWTCGRSFQPLETTPR